MSQDLILIDVLSSVCWEKNEKKKKIEKRSDQWAFFPGPEPDMPCWVCWARFSQLLGAIKG
jgi:hypothetical protein